MRGPKERQFFKFTLAGSRWVKEKQGKSGNRWLVLEKSCGLVVDNGQTLVMCKGNIVVLGSHRDDG